MYVNIAIVLSAIGAYLLGSIPSAVWIGKRFHGVDVREHGSGNAGATNTFRVLGKKSGIAVLSLDVLKGFAATQLVHFIPESNPETLLNFRLLFGISAVTGHIFPVFAGFRGGKGIATLLGMVIGVHPPLALVCIVLFLGVLLLSKYVSLGSMLATLAFPILAHFAFKEQSNWLLLFGIAATLMVFITHKKNIRRLLNGSETKTYLFK